MMHTSRFGQFDARERALLKVALIRLHDDINTAIDRGLAKPNYSEFEVTALIYELREDETDT